jgi:hypothetical protein
MSIATEKSKFVSSIPRNNLEPVFIGRADTEAPVDSSTDNKTGVYVPAFLKNKQEEFKSSSLGKEAKTSNQKKPQLNKSDFPELTTSKAKPQQVATQAGRMSFLDMLKKPKPEPIPADVVEKQVAQRGMLVLNRHTVGARKPASSWADDDEDMDFSAPPQFHTEYADEEEDEEDEYVDE